MPENSSVHREQVSRSLGRTAGVQPPLPCKIRRAGVLAALPKTAPRLRCLHVWHGPCHTWCSHTQAGK